MNQSCLAQNSALSRHLINAGFHLLIPEALLCVDLKVFHLDMTFLLSRFTVMETWFKVVVVFELPFLPQAVMLNALTCIFLRSY